MSLMGKEFYEVGDFLPDPTGRGRSQNGAGARPELEAVRGDKPTLGSDVARSVFAVERLGIEGSRQPGKNHFFENARVGPHSGLATKVAALGVDPCLFGDVAAVEEFVNIRNRHLSVSCAGNDEHQWSACPAGV